MYTSCKNKNLRSDNSFAVTSEGRYVQILEFILDLPTGKEFTLYNVVSTDDLIIEDKSTAMKTVTGISDDIYAIETHRIDMICVHITTLGDRHICAVPNLYYY